jgi:UDP-N-acetylmuramate--alanine ligase
MKIHFIGIGGIGVSALAKHYLENGWQISGSDLHSSDITETLERSGAKIIIGEHHASNIPAGADKVVYSPAVQEDNPELKEARRLQAETSKLQVLSYPQALGELTRDRSTIAVCGTHGKSTTTSMIGLVLMRSELDPTIIVGTKLKELGGSNYKGGKGQYLVIEACEHKASFLNYWPKVTVLTTLEADHLDYYKNLKNYTKAFKDFISHLPKDGFLVANKDDKNIQKLLKSKKNWGFKIINYSLKQVEAKKLKKNLKIPGEHNVSNALAALSAARILNIPDKISFQALSQYQGSWRRFEQQEIKIKNKNFILIDDYGHHPTEIKATLKAAREKFPKKEVWCFFQPHQYQRTNLLFKDFVKVLKEASTKKWADKIFVTDIYDVPGREDEASKKKVSAEKLADAAKNKNVSYLAKIEIMPFLEKNLKGKEIILAMGAGDIYQVFHKR